MQVLLRWSICFDASRSTHGKCLHPESADIIQGSVDWASGEVSRGLVYYKEHSEMRSDNFMCGRSGKLFEALEAES